MPWAGFFFKLREADLFVFLDDSQFTKNSYQNRVKIMTSQGPQWLTVPIKHNYGQLTRDVEIDNTKNWVPKHLGAIKGNYGKAKFFQELYAGIERIYGQNEWRSLVTFNLHIIACFMEYYGIKTKTICSSELSISEQSTSRLIEIVKKLRGDEYLSGSGGDKYQEKARFAAHGIRLCHAEYSFKPYSQRWSDEFIGGLSILDGAMNCGRDTTIF